MAVLVTGAAGFIGYHVSEALLARGESVIGVDDLNTYYDVALKKARLARLGGNKDFTFHRLDIAGRGALEAACRGAGVDRIVHLAAQAGVRYSLQNPFVYVRANLMGHIAVLELARAAGGFRHLVYASSSSVYGGNTNLPFATEDRTEKPVSLYAATKLGGEHMSFAYSHLYRIPQTGLRFFTVYGPWGRPDMAMYIFCKRITAGESIEVFNHGDMKRDFTYIDDIVAGVLVALDSPPADDGGMPPHRLYNIGNNRSEELMRMIALIESALGRKAEIDFQPMQPGDVKETYADITPIRRELGFSPTTAIDVGIPKFVDWFRDYEGV